MEETVRARGGYALGKLAALTEGGGRAGGRAEPSDSNHKLTYAPSQREDSQQDLNGLQMRKKKKGKGQLLIHNRGNHSVPKVTNLSSK